MNIVTLLQREEGTKEKAYHDHLGYPTIGTGHRLGPKDTPLEAYSYLRISKDVSKMILMEDIVLCTLQLEERFPEFSLLCEPRKAVLVSMSFQMGINGLMGFKKMLAAVKGGDWATAYAEGLNSRWCEQTPDRAMRQMTTMLVGNWSQYEG